MIPNSRAERQRLDRGAPCARPPGRHHDDLRRSHRPARGRRATAARGLHGHKPSL